LVGVFLNQLKGAYQRELDDFLDSVHGGTLSVSAVALCKARSALNPNVFSALNTRLLAHAADIVQPKHWHQWRVMAIDTSVLNLPKNDRMFKHFGGQRLPSKRGCDLFPMARFSQLCDSSGITYHATLEPYAIGEAVAAADHIEHAPSDAVLLYDRGYPGFFIMARHRQCQRHFCMRVATGFSKVSDALFQDSSRTSVQFELRPNPGARKLCKEHGVPYQPITVRAVRVELSTGPEVLITSLLDETQAPDADFGALYAMRWDIEGDFRLLKSRLQLENWTGKSPQTVLQDVFSRVLTKNIVRVVIGEAQRRLDAERAEREKAALPVPKFRKTINATAALHLCKFTLIAYLLSPDDQHLEPLVAQIIKNTHSNRPGRAFQRQEKRGKSNGFPMPYKQTA
jgi:Transposase DDE domain